MIGFLGWVWAILAIAVGVSSVLESGSDVVSDMAVSLVMAIPGLAAILWSTNRLGKKKSILTAAGGILLIVIMSIFW